MNRPSRLVLLGNPTAHSLSPRIHNAALHAAGIDLQYVAMDIAPSQLRSTLRTLRGQGGAGNLTIPFKQAAFELCDHVTSIAARAGAVNTFWVQDGSLIGDNTDVAGFDFAVGELLESAHADTPKRVTVIGSGGAAAAVAAAIDDWEGTELVIWSRNPVQAAALAQRYARARVEVALSNAVKGADLVVNATPIGMADDEQPIPIPLLPKKCPVLDLVYRRGETPWVRAARNAGHPASDGLPMLVEQAARSFRRWLGVEPNREVMWGALG
ncbi:MAG: shikimate dehydrogenase [Gemmatimonadota bacterium]|nr:shikimate dehydrogenase [Gemmatimonadota bacterium]